MSLPRDRLIAQLRESFAEQRRKFGVCCFCAGDPRNVLMWSHYAGAHFGICLQFETARDPPTLMRALRVPYVDRLKTIKATEPLYRKLRARNFVVALRERRIRIAPHLLNSTEEIERRLATLAEALR